MKATVVKVLKRAVIAVVALLVVVLAWRAYDALRAPHLARWHTFVPHEASAQQIARLDWAGYLQVEKQLFDEVRTEVTDKLEPEDQVESNRYFSGSPIYPGRFAQDWNRSYVLLPQGTPVGAVVLLHGLTDSPYSLRHVARRYVQDGFAAVAIRLPGHGTVPAGLSQVEWEQWMAATHLAVREARRLAPAPAPLHVVGFSNGGALAMKYALDVLDDPQLARPERIVLFAPMIGITSMARFAGVFGWPAFFPAFGIRLSSSIRRAPSMAVRFIGRRRATMRASAIFICATASGTATACCRKAGSISRARQGRRKTPIRTAPNGG